ncbi:hypothetical protein AB0F03_04140 [Streptomyces sp. NPDC028722]
MRTGDAERTVTTAAVAKISHSDATNRFGTAGITCRAGRVSGAGGR